MNRDRRKWITEVVGRFQGIRNEIELIRDEEQEAFDSLPESLQDGERGDMMQQAIDHLEEALQAIEEAESQLEEAQA